MKYLIILGCLLGSGVAGADPITVNSTDAVYNYDGSTTAGASSTTPPAVVIAPGTSYFTFSTTG